MFTKIKKPFVKLLFVYTGSFALANKQQQQQISSEIVIKSKPGKYAQNKKFYY